MRDEGNRQQLTHCAGLMSGILATIFWFALQGCLVVDILLSVCLTSREFQRGAVRTYGLVTVFQVPIVVGCGMYELGSENKLWLTEAWSVLCPPHPRATHLFLPSSRITDAAFDCSAWWQTIKLLSIVPSSISALLHLATFALAWEYARTEEICVAKSASKPSRTPQPSPYNPTPPPTSTNRTSTSKQSFSSSESDSDDALVASSPRTKPWGSRFGRTTPRTTVSAVSGGSQVPNAAATWRMPWSRGDGMSAVPQEEASQDLEKGVESPLALARIQADARRTKGGHEFRSLSKRGHGRKDSTLEDFNRELEQSEDEIDRLVPHAEGKEEQGGYDAPSARAKQDSESDESGEETKYDYKMREKKG